MKNIRLWGLLLIISIIPIMLLYNYIKEERAKAADLMYLDQAPKVRVDNHNIEIYSFNRCTYRDNPSPINPCTTTSKEEVLKGKSPIFLEKGSILEITSPIPPRGFQDANTPRDEMKGNWELSLTKDGRNLGPTDIKLSYKVTKEDYINITELPTGAGYYLGELRIGTPSGSIEYVFQFNIK
ncbi:hypothetical protein [Neobacillus bataviensis]|uniref:hypothetical protein n=1 Tax=Neobacillus bataviensis TaxID=220685 RepID=UPI001CC0A4AE|nr:hypothetical protein [Neobacillus bataviensis]